MIPADSFSSYYADFLEAGYDCVDRVVLNAWFSPGMWAGGFRTWWRRLFGTDDDLDNTHLMRMAGRFSRRVRGWAQKNNIPVIDCRQGVRKHDLAEQYLAGDAAVPRKPGVFCVFVSRAPYPIWEVRRFGKGGIDLKRKEPRAYVNHYSFQIWDEEWGHVAIKLCGHPPFTAQIMLNGHEYVAQEASRQKIRFAKEDNCFTQLADAPGLQRVADTLRCQDAIGRLLRVVERWLFHCLCLALDSAEQKKSGFQYTLSVYQAEYSRNLLFVRGRQLDQVFAGVIERTLGPLDLKSIKKIFGYKRRPRKRSGKKPRWEIVVEKPTYDLTVFKIHCDKLTLKIYSKGERVLRIEVIVHNARALPCPCSLSAFAGVVRYLQGVLERFLEVIRCVDAASIDDGTLDGLPLPSQIGHSRVAGVNIHQPRMVAVMQAVVALAVQPEGFTSGDVASKVRELQAWPAERYQPRHASYDLRKLRGKKLLDRRGKSRRYQASAEGLQTMVAVGILRDKVLKPVLARQWITGRPRTEQNPVNKHYLNLRKEMRKLLKTLRIPA
jgi:hypothetical protein